MQQQLMYLASEGASLDPLAWDPSALVLTWITFLIALGILTAVCWKPILRAAKDREDRIAANIKSAEDARIEAEKMVDSYRRQLDEAKVEVAALLEEGRREAGGLKDEIVTKAKTEAEAARERANREIELARDKAVAQIRAEAVDLSIAVASKVLDRSLDDEAHRKVAADVLTKI